MKSIKIEEHQGYYFTYDKNDSSIPVTIYSNWRKTGKTPAVIDESYSRPLKSADDRDRLYVTIATMGKKIRVYLDTLVASYALDNPHQYQKVIHKDLDIYNCHPSNLEWASQEDYDEFALKINRSKRKPKIFEVTYKDGRTETITGFLKFLEDNNLAEETLYKLRKGEIDEYNGIVSFVELKQSTKPRRKEEVKIDLSDYDTVELNNWPGYYIVYKKNDPNVKVRIFSKWKRVKDDMVLTNEFVRETTQHIHKTGYYQVNMKLPSENKIIQKVHRLVAQQLVENLNPEEFDTVDHIDWNKTNNHPSNLEWMRNSSNSSKGGNPELSNREKHYEITFDNGKTKIIKNLNKFCREGVYRRSALDLMIIGKQKVHKDVIKIVKV